MVGGTASVVGGGGAEVSVGNTSKAVDVGPSAGGVLVLVGPTGEVAGVEDVHADKSNAVEVKRTSKMDFGIWSLILSFLRFDLTFTLLALKYSLILPSI